MKAIIRQRGRLHTLEMVHRNGHEETLFSRRRRETVEKAGLRLMHALCARFGFLPVPACESRK